MKTLRFKLRLIATTLVLISAQMMSSATQATELIPNSSLRSRINSSYSKLLCKNAFSKSSQVETEIPRTRSATRGIEISRDLSRPLPRAVQEFDRKFSEVIGIEFDLPYGHETDPRSFYFLKNDPYEAEAKLDIWNRLGFKWRARQSRPDVAPTWVELAKNYQQLALSRGIDLKDTFVPAVVLYRTLEKVRDPVTGKTIEKKAYLFVDPIREDFPANMSEWKVLNKDVEFNLPFSAMLEGMKQGKFPLLDAVHDISHFVSFLRFPELTENLLRQIRTITPDQVSRGFKRRQYWLTEALSVLDPESAAESRAFLAKHKRKVESDSVDKIESELRQMSPRALLAYSLALARHFESRLRDVSGGNSSAAEKWFYLSASFEMRGKDLILENTSQIPEFSSLQHITESYFDDAPVRLNANPKPMTNETAVFSYSTFASAQKLLALILSSGSKAASQQLRGWSREKSVQYLVQFTSRMEWLLKQKPISYQLWGQAFLQADLPVDHEVSRQLMTVFGNTLVKRYYLGTGEKRDE